MKVTNQEVDKLCRTAKEVGRCEWGYTDKEEYEAWSLVEDDIWERIKKEEKELRNNEAVKRYKQLTKYKSDIMMARHSFDFPK